MFLAMLQLNRSGLQGARTSGRLSGTTFQVFGSTRRFFFFNRRRLASESDPLVLDIVRVASNPSRREIYTILRTYVRYIIEYASTF